MKKLLTDIVVIFQICSPLLDASRGEIARGGRHGGRDNRDLEIVQTRPPALNSKMGNDGRKINLITNYFRTVGPQWNLYVYHVDFKPEVLDDGLRKRLVRDHRSLFNGYLFDGTQIFSASRLQIPEGGTLELVSSDGEEPVMLVIKFTGDLSPTNPDYLKILNLIMRRCMATLKLKLVGRNYYDAEAKVIYYLILLKICSFEWLIGIWLLQIEIPQHRIQLWPGYLTSIRQHESDVLMCIEINTKLMRQETVYDILQRIHSTARDNWQTVFENTVLGSTILTRYNNRTMRIDEVDFKKTPMSTFETDNGPTTYVDYYLKVRRVYSRLVLGRAAFWCATL